MTSYVPQMLRAAGVDVMTRAQWGSPRERDGSYARRRSTHPMPSGPARFHFLHITVTPDTDTPLEGAAGARRVESYGLSSPPMVSYHGLVTNEGRYFEGQSYGVKGTHTINDKKVGGYAADLNYYGYAVAIMQNVGDAVTDAQVETLAKVYAAAELAGWVRRGAPIYPHRMFAWKSCPGDRAVARLDDIVRLKNQYVNAGHLPGSEPREWDDMASRSDIRDVVAEVVEAKLAERDETLKVRPKSGEKLEETSIDKVARMILHELGRILSRVNRLHTRMDAMDGPGPDAGDAEPAEDTAAPKG